MLDETAVAIFEIRLRQLVVILEPLARTCKCLESTMMTFADTFLFWLAVLATYDGQFKKNQQQGGLRLPDDVIEEIRVIINVRWYRLSSGAPQHSYLTTLFLDRCESYH